MVLMVDFNMQDEQGRVPALVEGSLPWTVQV
ncbi:MAG: hypothetical protein QOG21_2564, partial [Actinomycetota bacterium]|nr:hypothetical protein [Actinomycetota bacterium]